MQPPAALKAIGADTQALGFTMGSPPSTGELLRTLAASKPGGRLLELGTGTGLATAWLLDGMSKDATLITVDDNAVAADVAQRHLGDDARLEINVQDGLELLKSLQGQSFDLVFADTWPGKVDATELALNLVADGGLYVVDDMQLAWKEKSQLQPPVSNMILDVWKGQRRLIELLEQRSDFVCTSLDWSTGIMICTKTAKP